MLSLFKTSFYIVRRDQEMCRLTSALKKPIKQALSLSPRLNKPAQIFMLEDFNFVIQLSVSSLE